MFFAFLWLLIAIVSWYVKGRVIQKSEMIEWKNANGEGTLFHITILDAFDGQIKATFYKDACKLFYPNIRKDQVYILYFH